MHLELLPDEAVFFDHELPLFTDDDDDEAKEELENDFDDLAESVDDVVEETFDEEMGLDMTCSGEDNGRYSRPTRRSYGFYT